MNWNTHTLGRTGEVVIYLTVVPINSLRDIAEKSGRPPSSSLAFSSFLLLAYTEHSSFFIRCCDIS